MFFVYNVRGEEQKPETGYQKPDIKTETRDWRL